MKIFVTGGTGFVGKPVLDLLVHRGHEILVLTRSPEVGYDFNLKNLNYVNGDLRDVPAVRAAMKDFKPQALVHLAWEGLPDYGIPMCRQNLEYGVSLFSLAVESGCSCVLSVGSCWEYAGRKGMLSEDEQLDSTKLFPVVKSALRLIGEAIALENQIRFYWLRLFFVYGSEQRSTSLIPSIIQSLDAGRVPKIQNPDDRLDFVFVEDVAQAVAAVLERQPENSVYNIGSGRSIAVNDIVRIIHGMLNKPFEENGRKESKAIANEDFWADISRIQRDVGWKPDRGIESGIKSILETLKLGQ